MSGRNMHVEIQVALNFLISFLYNKLPRRRVNQFGEELEKALKEKFQGHWYPEKPFKGSAFRCLKTAPPLEPVFEVAARESGMDLADIQENLPRELSIWVDPGEVSYRMGEKLPVKILYSDGDKDRTHEREVARTFNPEAQCFKPIDSLSSQLAGLGLQQGNYANGNVSPTECHQGSSGSSPVSPGSPGSSSPTNQVFGTSTNTSNTRNHPISSLPHSPSGSVTPPNGCFKNTSTTSGGSTSSSNASSPGCGGGPTSFLGGKTPALTFTTAAFAQTKFGSTKLKTSSKRSHRMSPTEFSAYIKQRAMLQQQQQQQQHSAAAAMFVAAAAASSAAVAAGNNSNSNNGRPGSSSPLDSGGYSMMGNATQQAVSQPHHHLHNNNPFSNNGPSANNQSNANTSFGVFDTHGYLGDLFAAAAGSKLGSNNVNSHQRRSPTQQLPGGFSPYDHHGRNKVDNFVQQQTVIGGCPNGSNGIQGSPNGTNGGNKSFPQPLVDGVTFNLNVGPYPNQYQHLLVAN